MYLYVCVCVFVHLPLGGSSGSGSSGARAIYTYSPPIWWAHSRSNVDGPPTQDVKLWKVGQPGCQLQDSLSARVTLRQINVPKL